MMMMMLKFHHAFDKVWIHLLSPKPLALVQKPISEKEDLNKLYFA